MANTKTAILSEPYQGLPAGAVLTVVNAGTNSYTCTYNGKYYVVPVAQISKAAHRNPERVRVAYAVKRHDELAIKYNERLDRVYGEGTRVKVQCHCGASYQFYSPYELINWSDEHRILQQVVAACSHCRPQPTFAANTSNTSTQE